MMGKEELLFVPLGGVGEFGANVALYGFGGKWLMVDCGIAFADSSLPGVDILAPDLSWISERRKDLVGLVLTHAHEDHLGAVPYVWETLKCPVYATPFTAAILRNKLDERGLTQQVPLRTVALGGSVELKPFLVSYIPVAHSILEAHSVVVRSPAGLIVHSGDWKLDEEPCIGPLTEESVMSRLGDENVLALFGDSTNAMTDGFSGSEGALRRNLAEIVSESTGRVVVTQFASNAARIETVARIAKDNDRALIVVGRSLWRTIQAAQSCGYLQGLPPFLEDDEVECLPPKNTLLLLTGCQGEARGAMSRVAFGGHRRVRLSRNDTVIFSSKAIPGNERDISRVTTQLLNMGVRVITGSDSFVHVSGHPARGELQKMIEWIRPRMVVPVHGGPGHLSAHAELAKALGVEQAPVVANGNMLRIFPGDPEVIDEVPVGKLAISGTRLVELDSPGVQERRRMMFNGAISVFVVLNSEGDLLSIPNAVVRGVDVDEDKNKDPDEVWAVRVVRDIVVSLPKVRCRDDEAVELAIRRALRGELRKRTNQRPSIDIGVVRLDGLNSNQKPETAERA